MCAPHSAQRLTHGLPCALKVRDAVGNPKQGRSFAFHKKNPLKSLHLPVRHWFGRGIVTVTEFLSVWATGESGLIVGEGWTKNRGVVLNKWIHKAELGGIELCELTAPHLLRLQRLVIRDGRKNSTANRVVHHAFAAMIRDAVLVGQCDPAVQLNFRRVRKLREEKTDADRAPDEKHLQTILDYLEHNAPPWVYGFARWRVETGMRPTEVLGLRHCDIDRKNSRVTIAQGRDGTVITNAKTERSRRTIPIGRAAIAVLDLYPPGTGKDLVFVNGFGRPINLNNFRKRHWKPAFELAGVPYFKFKNLRHACASRLDAAGWSVKAVAIYLGDDPATAEAKYIRRVGGVPISPEQLDAGLNGGLPTAMPMHPQALRLVYSRR